MAGGGSFPTTLPGAAHTLMSLRWMHRKTGEQQPWGGSSGSLPPETVFSLSLFPFFFSFSLKGKLRGKAPDRAQAQRRLHAALRSAGLPADGCPISG